jgi:ABC-type cobalamin/Fe3+-siderophores transport system ATPase subunit
MSEPVLALEGIAQGYRRGRTRLRVLSDVSLTVGEREFVGLLGGRGEGKTTLLKIVVGMREPEEGRVRLDGRDLAECSSDERDDLLGDLIVWMPREDIAHFKVLESVALPLMLGRARVDEAEKRAMVALERVGAKHCADRQWDEISDWERLLVTFARGYASRPRLMVIDDLLDALGAGGTRQAGELLRSLVDELGCGVLAGASDLGALLAADRVLRFDGEGGLTEPPHPSNLVDLRTRRAGGI